MTKQDERRRELAVAAALAAVGGGLALYAASRQWWVSHTARPAPLPPVTEDMDGRAVAPWVPAMGFVGLAGAAAVLATRQFGRLVVGVLLLLAGAATAVGGVIGLRANPDDVGESIDPSAFPPWLAVIAGLLVTASGALICARFRRWQTSERKTLGSRYDSPDATAAKARDSTDPVALWDALDRGQDPTVER